ncbi:dihydrofolate reductase [Phycomyces nitens]|nr:dihydrofolate reductase [Phycomyces nitens]
MTRFALIVAATNDLGIGVHGGLPWRIPKDMAFFKHVTTLIPRESKDTEQNAVIMGRVTWESIPSKFRPLPDRFNVVVSRNLDYDLHTEGNAVLAGSLEEAFKATEPKKPSRVFIIGGAQMYSMAIKKPECTHIILTRILNKVDCDVFFPEIDLDQYRLASHEELESYVEQEVPKGIQTHKEYEYKFQMYIRYA